MSKELREVVEERIRKENKKSDFVCLYKAYEVSKIDPNDELKLDLHSDVFTLDEVSAVEVVLNELAKTDIFNEDVNGSLLDIIMGYKFAMLKLNIRKHGLLNQLDNSEINEYPSGRYSFKISLDDILKMSPDNIKLNFDIVNIENCNINCDVDNDKHYLTITEMTY